MTRLLLLATLIGLPSLARADESLTVRTDRFEARSSRGGIEFLRDSTGRVLVRAGETRPSMGIERIPGRHPALADRGDTRLVSGGSAKRSGTAFQDLPGATAHTTFTIDSDAKDLCIEQQCTSPLEGVWGVSWQIAEIPYEYAILVPGNSGVRLSADAPGQRHTFDYPLGWEAQLVIVEGPGHGFYVWADDAQGRFKRLTVERGPTGWRLQLATINQAPFEHLTACRSVRWRLNTYEGDWRVPARRYRDWTDAHFRPTPVDKQKPEWVKDIDCCVIMGLQRDVLEALPRRLVPARTLLYLPDWRKAGYDRDYPVYDQVRPDFEPFLQRAKELGFRLMLHTNYFGVDPLNRQYADFERYHVRSPWGKNEKLWWLWTRATPEIRFAYINPAAKAWRRLFVDEMVRLCRRYPVDALHLDQTLCIYNDHNGLIEGLTMIDGNVALHRELRDALPQVALSGEGLNEMTCRYEAFAQRHAWGLDHAHDTWDRAKLACAHPISSYLLRPYTVIYGYLGYVPPTRDQMYAAWNEAYEHWGVIPTLKPALAQFAHPTGFSRQFFDEADFWFRRRPRPDMDAAWPATMLFPFRTADGAVAARMRDGRLVCDGRQISRTITGQVQADDAGVISGWRAYDGRRLLGLHPDNWYPVFDDSPPRGELHVRQLADSVAVGAIVDRPELALVSTKPVTATLINLASRLHEATCGSNPFDGGTSITKTGPLRGADGSLFDSDGSSLQTHPPYKAEIVDPQTGKRRHGTGTAYARFSLALPAGKSLRFVTELSLGKGNAAPGKSDGVACSVTAQRQEQKISQEILVTSETPQPLELDLSPLAGKTITLELRVHPGPKRHVSFDSTSWIRPRIEHRAANQVAPLIVGPGRWTTALSEAQSLPVVAEGEYIRINAPQPGSVCLLRDPPEKVTLPVDLPQRKPIVALMNDSDERIENARYAGVTPSQGVVGGVRRPGLRAHPPDHGRTLALFPMFLPQQPARLHSFIGICEGSQSTGVVFLIQVNGQTVASRTMLPGRWEELDADLAPWAGKPCLVGLVTDSDGPFNFDWAVWGEPRINAP